VRAWRDPKQRPNAGGARSRATQRLPDWFHAVREPLHDMSTRYELPPGFRDAMVDAIAGWIDRASLETATHGGEGYDLEVALDDPTLELPDLSSMGVSKSAPPSAVDVIAAELELPDAFRDAVHRLIRQWRSAQPVQADAESTLPPAPAGLASIDGQITVLCRERGLPHIGFRTALFDLIQTWRSTVDAARQRRRTTHQALPKPRFVEAPTTSDAPWGLPRRYEDAGQLGVGGMGEVRRMSDRRLDRSIALKALRQDLQGNQTIEQRFVNEAQVTAQLQHPGIVPVYDIGRLPDGRMYYTMQEIRGIEFTQIVDELHDAKTEDGRWQPTPSGWTLRRAIDVLHSVCEAMAYAHARGVLHRDLKPDNIMVGDFGEVFVVDWGIARVVTQAPDSTEVTEQVKARRGMTLDGMVAGTPGYMPPEQVLGRAAEQGPHTDVYALGAILYELLGGLPPCDDGQSDDVDLIMARTLSGEIEPLAQDQEIPESLAQVAIKALALQPAERYPTAREVAVELSAYLEGAKRRERALDLLRQAHEKSANCVRLRDRADAIRQSASAYDDDERPEPRSVAWKRDEQAARLDHGAEVLDVVVTQLASAALAQFPDLPEAHELLADHYRRGHEIAEVRGDRGTAERYRILLNAHDNGRYARYLKGDGAISLITDPPGARVEVFRCVEQGRRLIAEPFGSEALTTPIVAHPLPMGSYLLVIRHPGRRTVRYPVLVEREAHWDGVPPGQTEPQAIPLPAEDKLDDTEVYVPAGWMLFGSEEHGDTLPRGRVWVDGFVIQRHPITNGDYLRFISSLVPQRRDEDALRFAPQTAGYGASPGVLLWNRDRHGNFALPDDGSGERPAVLISWEGAQAYAVWRSVQDGVRWQLPHELQWAKSARGVDGRPFPWGYDLDPDWCAMRESANGPVHPESFRDDASPYGVRGLGGNVSDWCRNVVAARSPIASGTRLVVREEAPGLAVYRAVRGGSWASTADACRSTARHTELSTSRRPDLGFRLIRPLLA